MASAVLGIESKGVLRFSRWDALFVALAAIHSVILLAWPTAAVVAIGVWWNSNTIAHNFIHRPFFRARFLNLLFSAYLSVLLGTPQTLWRDRHLAHHAGVRWCLRLSRQLVVETMLVFCLWTVLSLWNPRFFLAVYLPGYLIGLGLCALQGHYEHARGATSHYGPIYNLLCFNDGYHVEHHANPAVHWTGLPARLAPGAPASRWPALLRWLDNLAPGSPLVALEKLVLRSRCLQRVVLRCHRRAFCVRELLPGVEIVIIDASSQNLAIARPLIGGNVEFVNEHYVPSSSRNCDLLVIPLSLEGDRAAIYRHPPARAVLVHDWIWRRRGRGRIVSVALLKRLNLVTP